ncbi:hypothetical protein [Insolitispirillum peregrinum]|uniref:Uncharacterized protein n=1 Tax=Insolitispirillum peregrinum TaxID=80876 RepID=A0A1N7P297_9PROT|nr:hypothetical protein [Insolitispirillum peregrinum]SIT04688.1 hypothetical protein SAMN05421779_1067 [Insolitispirillum peregrinum]
MITLKRIVQVQSFECSATVAVEQESAAFQCLAQLAADFEGCITPQLVQKELYAPLPLHACQLAIKRCVDLKMFDWIDQQQHIAQLTDLGEVMVKNSRILIPQQDLWRFYLVDDPLVPNPLVHLEWVKAEPAHHVVSKEKKGEKISGAGDATPALLKDLVDGQPSRSLADRTLRQVRDVSAKGKIHKSGTLELRLDWAPESQPRVSLSGTLQDTKKIALDQAMTGSLLPDWTYEDLWIELAAAASDSLIEDIWMIRERFGHLAIPGWFDTLDSQERKSFEKTLETPEIGLESIGIFAPSMLQQVSLFPGNETEAQRWCEWLQFEQVTNYVTPDQLRDQAQKVLGKFPFHRPQALEPDAMLAQALSRTNDPAMRHILAPADLGLWS